MIRRPPRSTLDRSSAASDVYKRQFGLFFTLFLLFVRVLPVVAISEVKGVMDPKVARLSLIHISEPTRPY